MAYFFGPATSPGYKRGDDRSIFKKKTKGRLPLRVGCHPVKGDLSNTGESRFQKTKNKTEIVF